MSRDEKLWLAGLTLLAAALRFPTLDVQSFWFDESVTAVLLRRDFGDMLAAIPDSESTPPLYYVLAWGWAKLFGAWEVGLRSFSALCGTALVPVVYLIACRLTGSRAALAATALTAVNPLLVWYSQEARAYALLLLLCAVSLLFLLRALDGFRVRELVLWGLLSALALATHYFAVFVVAPQAVYLALAARRAGRARRVAVAALAPPALAGLALAPLALDQRSNEFAAHIEESSLGRRLAQLPKQLIVGFDLPAETLASIVALALAAVGLWLAVRRTDPDVRRRLAPAGLLAAAIAGLPLLLAVLGSDYFNSRNVMAVWLPVAVILGAGFAAQRARPVGQASLAALVALSLALVVAVAAEPRYQREDWRGVADALGRLERDRVLLAAPRNSQIPLGLYAGGIRRMPMPSHAADVAVVAVAQREQGGREAPRLPDTAAVAELTATHGFTEAGRRVTESFGLVTLRTPAPVELFDWELGFLIPPGEFTEFLFQTAERR